MFEMSSNKLLFTAVFHTTHRHKKERDTQFFLYFPSGEINFFSDPPTTNYYHCIQITKCHRIAMHSTI
jgi:hypothetical protein